MKIKILSIVAFATVGVFLACGDDSDDVVANTKLTINTDIIVVSEGATEQIEATMSDHSAINYSSSDENIVVVTNDGLVMGIACGYAEITISAGTQSESIPVKVTPRAYDGYSLVWNDEFNASSLDRMVWNIEQGGGGWGNQEKQYYTDREENLRVADGNLVINVRKEQYGNNEYTSARITTKNNKDFTFGRVEARIKLPKGGGTWPAFWMLGYGSWPLCGEIDIMEHVGNKPNMVSFALHTKNKNGMNGTNWHNQPNINSIEDDFHIFGVEWLEKMEISTGVYRQGIRFMVDGEVLATQTQSSIAEDKNAWPFFNPFYIILNCAVGGTMGGNVNDNIFANQDTEPVQMLVDWVRVYQVK